MQDAVHILKASNNRVGEQVKYFSVPFVPTALLQVDESKPKLPPALLGLGQQERVMAQLQTNGAILQQWMAIAPADATAFLAWQNENYVKQLANCQDLSPSAAAACMKNWYLAAGPPPVVPPFPNYKSMPVELQQEWAEAVQ